MPSFTLDLGPQGYLFVNAFIGVSAPYAKVLTDAGDPIPEIQQIKALIDTGASGSAIDPSVVKAMGLSPTGTIQIHTPTTKGKPENASQYSVSLFVPGPGSGEGPYMNAIVQVTECELLHAQNFHMLIGMDIIKDWVLIVNGPEDQFTLSY